MSATAASATTAGRPRLISSTSRRAPSPRTSVSAPRHSGRRHDRVVRRGSPIRSTSRPSRPCRPRRRRNRGVLAPTSSPLSTTPPATVRRQCASRQPVAHPLHRPAAPRHGPGLDDDRSVYGIGQRMAHRTAVGHRPARHRIGHAAARWTSRSIEEAIWHGGEAQHVTDAFMALSAEDRAALLRFVASR